MATFSVTKGHTFSSGQTVTDVNLNALGTPTVSLNPGSIGLSDLGQGSVDLSKFATGLLDEIKKEIFPIGSIFISTDSNEPDFGTWVSFGAGRVLLGQSTVYPAGSEGGSVTKSIGPHTHEVTYDNNGTVDIPTDTGIDPPSIGTTSSSGSHDVNVMQPYISVYMWKRTA